MSEKIHFLPWERKEEFREFLKKCGVLDEIRKGYRVGLKIHFGEKGNPHYIPPYLVKIVGEVIKDKGAKCWLIDSNVLYRGMRARTSTHLEVAKEHGFMDIGIPVKIAGDFAQEREKEVIVNLKHFRKVYILEDFLEFDYLILLTHFKGHALAGIGGSIKNLSMGCASRKGKYKMHSKMVPQIKKELCIGCETCAKHCPGEAIKVKNGKAKIIEEKCLGCGECIQVCPTKAISIPWESVKSEEFQERLVEYAFGIWKERKGSIFAINFLHSLSPDCDCLSKPAPPLAPDIGIVAGKNIVEVDEFSLKKTIEVKGYHAPEGVDKFLHHRPNIPTHIQMEYGKKLFTSL
ncbi:MAG TPA: DUF362 domain-containing protein [bacterium]|nr:DUF362 domain-containing protein [bacterium]HEX68355.1 DUF362 domain-containing protein [bacterium]